MKSFFSALFGFVFSLFVEGFSRIIISFFHKQEFFFFGFSALPSFSWIITIYIVSIIATWLGAMLAMSIADESAKRTFKIVTILTIFWILFELLSSFNMVPNWYLTTFPITSIIGLVLSKITYQQNTTNNALSDS